MIQNPRTMKYFNRGYQTLQDLRVHYYELAKKFHPDMGGTNEEMQEINNEYESLYDQVASGQYDKWNDWSADFKDKFYTGDAELREIIDQFIHLSDLTIEICGNWMWVSGPTREYKEYLKENGLRFSPKKVAWYWHPKGYRKQTKKEWSLDQIRDTFGSRKVETEEQNKLAS